MQVYVWSLRRAGGIINTRVVVAAGKGIVEANDRSLLAENGGSLDLNQSWAKSLLIRMNFVKRKASTGQKIPPADLETIRAQFLDRVSAAVKTGSIPSHLVLNWDQTAIPLLPAGQWTMEKEGSRRVVVTGLGDKRQITGVFCSTMEGDFLPPQLLYEGRTERCHPSFSFPKDWDIWHSRNHWSNEDTMPRYLEKIIVPFISKKREELKHPPDHPALAIFDVFRGQRTERFLSTLKEHHIEVVFVPANCTDHLEPLDLSINKPFKDQIKSKFVDWYASEVKKQLENGVPLEQVKVDMSV